MRNISISEDSSRRLYIPMYTAIVVVLMEIILFRSLCSGSSFFSTVISPQNVGVGYHPGPYCGQQENLRPVRSPYKMLDERQRFTACVSKQNILRNAPEIWEGEKKHVDRLRDPSLEPPPTPHSRFLLLCRYTNTTSRRLETMPNYTLSVAMLLSLVRLGSGFVRSSPSFQHGQCGQVVEDDTPRVHHKSTTTWYLFPWRIGEMRDPGAQGEAPPVVLAWASQGRIEMGCQSRALLQGDDRAERQRACVQDAPWSGRYCHHRPC